MSEGGREGGGGGGGGGVFTTGKLVRPIRTVRVGVALLLLGNALVVATAELVRRADGWGRG